jgi:hypothetical protein
LKCWPPAQYASLVHILKIFLNKSPSWNINIFFAITTLQLFLLQWTVPHFLFFMHLRKKIIIIYFFQDWTCDSTCSQCSVYCSFTWHCWQKIICLQNYLQHFSHALIWFVWETTHNWASISGSHAYKETFALLTLPRVACISLCSDNYRDTLYLCVFTNKCVILPSVWNQIFINFFLIYSSTYH